MNYYGCVEMNRSILRLARLAQNLTQQELGDRVGVYKTTICQLEAGKVDGSSTTWARLEATLGVDQRLLQRIDHDGLPSEGCEAR